MAKEKEAQEATQEEITYVSLEEFEKFKMQFNQTMQSLNRILSTYEDEISSLKNMNHDLSYKLKIIQQNLPQE